MTSARHSARPSAVTFVLAVNVINAVIGIVFAVAWPDLDERATIIVVSSVISVLFVSTAWLFFRGYRWGAIGNVVVNAFSILLAVPGFFDPDGAAFVAALMLSIALSAIAIVLTLTPEPRSFVAQRGVNAQPTIVPERTIHSWCWL